MATLILAIKMPGKNLTEKERAQLVLKKAEEIVISATLDEPIKIHEKQEAGEVSHDNDIFHDHWLIKEAGSRAERYKATGSMIRTKCI